MKRVLGIVAILLAALVGVVEFRAVVDPNAAQSISNAFAAHDPFPRLPWDYHVIVVLLFLGPSRGWTTLHFWTQGTWHVSHLTKR
jgi:hypothetical protein